jgi:hypothetical protein
MKNNFITITSSGILSYTGIKSLENKIDPYTRMSLGLLMTLGLSLSEYQTTRSIGVGLGVASILQLSDIRKGGKLVSNLSPDTVYVLDENNGVKSLKPGQLPKYSIDGLTIKGLNGVFKISDGIYIEVGINNNLKYTSGIGRIINKNVRSAGFKTLKWVTLQKDSRWKELFDKSI